MSFGGSIGYAFQNKKFADLFDSEANTLTSVYEGLIVRAYHKFFLHKNEEIRSQNLNRYFYLAPQFVYKDLHYHKYTFSDAISDAFYHVFTRSEEMAVIGFDVILGTETVIDDFFFIDFFTGIGGRIRYRNYIDYYDNSYHGISAFTPVNYKKVQEIMSFSIGMKIGFILF